MFYIEFLLASQIAFVLLNNNLLIIITPYTDIRYMFAEYCYVDSRINVLYCSM